MAKICKPIAEYKDVITSEELPLITITHPKKQLKDLYGLLKILMITELQE